MNKASIIINSYLEKASFYWNGQEFSLNSRLMNYTYRDILLSPLSILETIANETNDEFRLFITGNLFEFELFFEAAKECDDCIDCTHVIPEVALSSAERAEALDAFIGPKTLRVAVSGVFSAELYSEIPRKYGNISVVYGDEELEGADLKINVSGTYDCTSIETSKVKLTSSENITADELANSIAALSETLLINPIIGEASKRAQERDNALILYGMTTPLVVVDCEAELESGDISDVTFSVFPKGARMPEMRLKSSSPEIFSVDGCRVVANSPGTAKLLCYKENDLQSFVEKAVTVISSSRAIDISLSNMPQVLHQGKSYPLLVTVVPESASDAACLKWSVSDTSVASVKNGRLVCEGFGKVSLFVKASRCEASVDIEVLPALQEISLSKTDVELRLGESTPITVSVFPEDTYNQNYSWVSSDTSVAEIAEQQGQVLIRSVGIGSCTLTCVNEDKTRSIECSVTVKSRMYDATPKRPTNPISFVAWACLLLSLLIPTTPIVVGFLRVLGLVLSLTVCIISKYKRKFRPDYVLLAVSVLLLVLRLL